MRKYPVYKVTFGSFGNEDEKEFTVRREAFKFAKRLSKVGVKRVYLFKDEKQIAYWKLGKKVVRL